MCFLLLSAKITRGSKKAEEVLMGKKLTKAVANWLLYDDMETGELNEIYMYGVGQLGINIFNMLTALTIGFLFGELLVSVVYIISFVFLRSYAGGYHASTPMRCYALTVASIILVLLTVKYVSLSVFCLLLLFIMSSIVILLLAPIDTINKRLDEIEHIHYRKKASVVLALECLIVILSLVFHNILFLESIIFSQFTIAISLICGELKNYLQSDSLNGGKML